MHVLEVLYHLHVFSLFVWYPDMLFNDIAKKKLIPIFYFRCPHGFF